MKNPHRIIAKIASWSRQMMEGSDLQFYLTWLKDQLKTQNEYLPSVARCLQMMLRLDPYRMAFDKIEGIKAIIAVLSSKVNFQIQYQVSYTIFLHIFPQTKSTPVGWTLSLYWLHLPLHFFRNYKIFENTFEIDIFFEKFRKICQISKVYSKKMWISKVFSKIL